MVFNTDYLQRPVLPAHLGPADTRLNALLSEIRMEQFTFMFAAHIIHQSSTRQSFFSEIRKTNSRFGRQIGGILALGYLRP